MSGRFIAVVGPSGVGKDSLIDALCARRPDMVRARRVITRDPEAGGEDYDAVSPALFAARAAGGDFALHWRAHDLQYGIPVTVKDALREGQDVIANLSRRVLTKADQVFDDLRVLHVTARPPVLAKRLATRGRESKGDIARRLARQVPPLPEGLTIIEIDNSGTLDTAVKAALDAL
ncbi:MAG: phosphonate metabolism protein/1,5-bisphosphokinase (PRPP-forming) PhnN, partial [Pseudomonadota bacterium]